MAVEKKLLTIALTPFTANGTAFGVVTIADTIGFKTKQIIYLSASGLPTCTAQVKRVISPTQLIVGPIDGRVETNDFIDLSLYTVALDASIGAAEQSKNNIPDKDHYVAIYESDPIVADRVIPVDPYGNYYDANNPVPVALSETLQIGNVSIVEGGNTVKVNPDGSINVVVESVPVSGQVVVSTYNEIVAVPSGSTTQLVTYTVPPSSQAVLQRCPVSGDNIARYDLLINGITQDTLRTMFGGDLTQTFDFTSGNDSGLLLHAGNIVKIQVLHNRPYLGTFEGRIQVLQMAL
jgi:hypothetical protein